MRRFIVRYNSFTFGEKNQTIYNFAEVSGRDCYEALFNFMRHSTEEYEADIEGIKPKGSLRWRTDAGLLNKTGILKTAIQRGYIPAPTEDYVAARSV